jgi:hypothetical protein
VAAVRASQVNARLAALLLVACCALAGGVASAQPVPSECPDGRVVQIEVEAGPIFDAPDSVAPPRFAWAYRLANRLHTSTRPEVIRRELLFAEGDCFDPLLLQDSERLLRNLRFLAEAEVVGLRLPSGDVRVRVRTRDEWSKRIEVQTGSRGGLRTRGLELREDNLVGTGQQVAAYYRQSLDDRSYGVVYATPHLWGSPLDADFAVGRTLDDGYLLSETIAYPFRGEAGRWAWRQHFAHEDRFFQFFVPVEGKLERILLPERRRLGDVGGVFRLGQRGNFSLIGLALSGEWISYRGAARAATPEITPLPRADTLGAALDPVSSFRLMFLIGQRNVYFVRRDALDAVRGAEDVRLGVEAELGVGRSLPAFSSDDDLAFEVGLSAAGELPNGILSGAKVTMEAKRDFDGDAGGPEWTDVLGQLDAWSYWRPHPRHTLVAGLAAAGGWHTTVPFQITLGEATGLRGFPGYLLPGGRRVVGSLEARSYLAGPYPRLADLGSVVFMDVGRSWGGDDPFGNDSDVEVGAGVGVRMAFPPGSRRTYRLDVGQAIGRAASGVDPQIRRSSRRAVAASLFSFPN